MVCSWFLRNLRIRFLVKIVKVVENPKYGVHWVGKGCIRACIHETWSGQMSAQCRSEQEPYAPFLSGGDVRSGSKLCCIFNESLTSSVPLSHYLSCQCLLHPHLHGTLRQCRKQRMPLKPPQMLSRIWIPPTPSLEADTIYSSTMCSVPIPDSKKSHLIKPRKAETLLYL